ncbi:MAG: site-specific integrase, partial [Planctomycetales bacterium]|nr:site-specific integrase [Planctomycetales bacterium]
MHAAIDAFLQFLRIERNASPMTLKSYHEDLESVREYFETQQGKFPPPDEVTTADLRGYVAYLHDCQYARSTMARRLACLRSFFRYCCREGYCQANPAKALRTPRAGRRLPHFLTAE